MTYDFLMYGIGATPSTPTLAERVYEVQPAKRDISTRPGQMAFHYYSRRIGYRSCEFTIA